MAKQLWQIVSFTGVAGGGGMASLPHDIGDFSHNVAYIPDEAEVDHTDFEIVSCTDTTLTVRNNGVGAAHGGVDIQSTQLYDGATWLTPTIAEPTARYGASLAWSGGTNRFVLFGGAETGGGALNDVWVAQ